MKTVTMILPTTSVQGKLIALPARCCVCLEPSAGVVRVKENGTEGAFASPAVDVPYCHQHLELGQKFKEKFAESNALVVWIVVTRLVSVACFAALTFIVGPDLIPQMASMPPFGVGIVGVIVGVVFTLIGVGGGAFTLYDNFFRLQVMRRNNIVLPEAMKDSRLALGLGTFTNKTVDAKAEIQLDVLNDAFADVAQAEHVVKAV